MSENEIAKIVVNTCFDIHVDLGPGLFESVYEEILCYELIDKGLFVERQRLIPVYWKGLKMEKGFIADIIVDDSVIIEIKSVEKVGNVHYKQLLTYLKLTDIKLGLLVNFNEALLKNGIKRIVNNM
jgi:GxxExxY protein